MKKFPTLLACAVLFSSMLFAANPTFEHVASIHLGSRYQKIVERDGYWYLAGEWGLECWQFNGQNEFVKLSEVATPGIAQWVALEGNYAYVADGWEGLTIIEITDPNNLTFVSNYIPPYVPQTGRPGFYPFVNVQNQIVYLSGTCVLTIDARNPSAPAQTAQLAIPDTSEFYNNTTGMTLPTGSTLWVARTAAEYHGDTTFYGIYRYDISDPMHPEFQYFIPAAAYTPSFLALRDSIMFAAGNWGLWTYRLNPDSTLSPLDSMSDLLFHTGNPLDMALGDNRVYLAGNGGSYLNGGIAVVDISDPANVSVIEDYRKPEMFNSVAISGEQVVAGYWQDGLLLMSTVGLGDLDSTGYVYSAANVNNLALRGEYLYVNDVFNGIHCFDIADPFAPMKFELLERTNPRCLDVWKNDLLVGHDTSPYLYIFDVSTALPQLSDSLLMPNSAGLAVIAHRDSMIFVGAGDMQISSLHVVIESRGNYRHVLEIPADNVVDLAVNDQFVATPRSIYSIDNDTSMSLIKSFGSVWLDGAGVALIDSTIITAEQNGGMSIFRLTAPGTVEVVGTWFPWPDYHSDANWVSDVLAVTDSIVILTAWKLGIEAINLPVVTEPQHLTYSSIPSYASKLLIDSHNLYVGAIWGVDIFGHDNLVDVDTVVSGIPSIFSLQQNFPNPFNSYTAIPFTIEKASRVSLDIINIEGRVVRCLENRTLSDGHHTVVWDGLDKSGKEAASGIYFARLTTNDRSTVIKLVLIR